jgi:hypothetical protein
VRKEEELALHYFLEKWDGPPIFKFLFEGGISLEIGG